MTVPFRPEAAGAYASADLTALQSRRLGPRRQANRSAASGQRQPSRHGGSGDVGVHDVCAALVDPFLLSLSTRYRAHDAALLDCGFMVDIGVTPAAASAPQNEDSRTRAHWARSQHWE